MSRFADYYPPSSTSASSRGDSPWSRNSRTTSSISTAPTSLAASTERRSVSFKEPYKYGRYYEEPEDDTEDSLIERENELRNRWERETPHYYHHHESLSPRDTSILPAHSHTPKSTRESNSWTPNSTQDSTIYLQFECSEDIEVYLEELSRLKRLGRCYDAKQYFESCSTYCGDHPDFIIEYVDILLSQGACKDVLELITTENRPILTKDCGQIYHHYLHSAFCAAKAVTLGWSDEAVLQWGQAKSELISELKRDFTKLSSIQIRFLCHLLYLETPYELSMSSSYLTPMVESITVFEWRELYSHLLLTNRVWDMRDIFYHLLGSLTVKQVVGMFFDTKMSLDHSINTFATQWAQEHDESTNLAILDVLATLLLRGIPEEGLLDKADRQWIDLCMIHSRNIATSIRENYPASIKSSPYLRWILAEVRWADVSVESQESSRWSYLDDSPGLLYFDGRLPIYVPFASENPGWRIPPLSEHTIELLILGLNTARDLGHYYLEVLYLEELVCRSNVPEIYLADLKNLQKNVIGNDSGYLSACLAQYLLGADQDSQKDLSNELCEIDRQDDSTNRGNPILKWAQRQIQQAISRSLGSPQAQQDLYSWMERSAYHQIPEQYRDQLQRFHPVSHNMNYYRGENNIAKYVVEGRAPISYSYKVPQTRTSPILRRRSPSPPRRPYAEVPERAGSSALRSHELPFEREKRLPGYTLASLKPAQNSSDDRVITDLSERFRVRNPKITGSRILNRYDDSEKKNQTSSLSHERNELSSEQAKEISASMKVDNRAGTRSIESESRSELSTRVAKSKGIEKHDNIVGEPSRTQEVNYNSPQADRTKGPRAQYFDDDETKKDPKHKYANSHSSDDSE
ncbi:hypothetical protein BCIN_16g04260 [Botrytis cinerea B05.10]|uniref:Uncharacterized protein n=2 Tax=Botryotinia fuckeliana TaxID=40559 RepID=A0A384K7D5_BOTFB|nr:hypothetical protein BCIN_16g04260 [Botrytis cinerea B05.10]ATZ58726.1 hypothetical protein BCIN_16g04260 [Botrytis cinerea B05.10]CCD55972.1 hypothetical protein BofuT4_P151040.1 [Botrytis cinerea T4]